MTNEQATIDSTNKMTPAEMRKLLIDLYDAVSDEGKMILLDCVLEAGK